MNESYPSSWTRALLPTATLRVLAGGPAHGYAIAQALDELGFGRPKGGSLYPVLAKLEDQGFITGQWAEGDGGPGRKTYAITASGAAELDAARTRLGQLHRALSD